MDTARDTQLDTRETARLIASDKVEGTSVRNRAGESVGTIERVMIDKRSGKVAYAVLSFGGFLGIGSRYHALPWSMLAYDTSQDAYVVDLDRRLLEGAPSYDAATEPNWDDQSWGRQVHDYYGVTPYWY